MWKALPRSERPKESLSAEGRKIIFMRLFWWAESRNRLKDIISAKRVHFGQKRVILLFWHLISAEMTLFCLFRPKCYRKPKGFGSFQSCLFLPKRRKRPLSVVHYLLQAGNYSVSAKYSVKYSAEYFGRNRFRSLSNK